MENEDKKVKKVKCENCNEKHDIEMMDSMKWGTKRIYFCDMICCKLFLKKNANTYTYLATRLILNDYSKIDDTKINFNQDEFWKCVYDSAQELVSKSDTPIEKLLAIYLSKMIAKRKGVVTPQCEIKCILDRKFRSCTRSYRVDFLIETSYGKRYVVECDGHEFHQKTKEQVENDYMRDRTLIMNGFKVIRFSGSEIYNNAEYCFEQIEDIILEDEDRHVKELRKFEYEFLNQNMGIEDFKNANSSVVA